MQNTEPDVTVLDEQAGSATSTESGYDSPATNRSSSIDDNLHPDVFEGPEKTMEVVFLPGKGPPDGLRSLERSQIDFLCVKAKCSILSKNSNLHVDAYVLSESSLFVYRHKLIMKTCGTTTLLRCLSSLLEFADAIGMHLTWVGYSRKNLMFPSAQEWPHSNFEDEIRYIRTHEHLQNRLKGNGHILGPITGDHWFVYVADHSLPPSPSPAGSLSLTDSENTSSLLPSPPSPSSDNLTINLMMFDLPEEVLDTFWMKKCPTGKEMTVMSGINNLCPGASIDETAFEPCGYSMNAILHDTYYTIHITPQQECSYASFETNTAVSNYAPIVRNTLIVFRPKRFVLTMFGDQDAIDGIPTLPTEQKTICLPTLGSYSRTSVSSTKIDRDLCCLMAVYTFEAELQVPTSPKSFVQDPNARLAARLRERGNSMF